MSSGSANKSIELQRDYLAALKKHLEGGPRASLLAAGKLGRRAVTGGISAAALGKIHARALVTLVSAVETPRTTNGKARASSFFAAVLEPMAGVQGATVETNGQLARLKETMRLGTIELADSRRRLKRELARSNKLEAALKKSKQQHLQLEKKSLRVQEQLRLLSHRILSAQEEERRKISRELHDEIGQTLTAINVKLATLKREANVNAKALQQTIGTTQRLLESSMKTVHRFARNLRPPLLDDLGLIPALDAHLDAFTKQNGIPIRFTAFAEVEKLDNERRTVLYRVTQEALANVARHARASLVIMTIRRKAGVVALEIHDNGKGFDVARRLSAKRLKRLGLLGMRERLEMVGGSFQVESEPQHGTTVRAIVPLADS